MTWSEEHERELIQTLKRVERALGQIDRTLMGIAIALIAIAVSLAFYTCPRPG